MAGAAAVPVNGLLVVVVEDGADSSIVSGMACGLANSLVSPRTSDGIIMWAWSPLDDWRLGLPLFVVVFAAASCSCCLVSRTLGGCIMDPLVFTSASSGTRGGVVARDCRVLGRGMGDLLVGLRGDSMTLR